MELDTLARVHPLRVGIVGCGTAGPAAAILLAREGHRVTILERAPELHPVGAGLLLQPTGLAVLDRLGLLRELLSLGSRIDRLDGRTRSGRRVLNLAYGDLSPQHFGLGLHRGALFGALLDGAVRGGASVRVDCDVQAITRSDGGMNLVDARSRSHGPFDLVVVADGARSSLRHVVPWHRVRRYAWAALWFVAERRDAMFDGTLSQVYDGTRRMIGFLPSGRAGEVGPSTVSVFWSLAHDTHASVRAAGLEAWRGEALALAPHADVLLSQIRSFDECTFAAYYDSSMRPCFHREWPIVFLGDAAHAMSPQLGQGANLALVDAAELAECLATESSVAAALSAYDVRRAGHVRFYSRASRWLTPWFQSDATLLAWPRDVLMHRLSSVGWIRRQMLLSLAGVKDGLCSARGVVGPCGTRRVATDAG